jgi:hypothetical protein
VLVVLGLVESSMASACAHSLALVLGGISPPDELGKRPDRNTSREPLQVQRVKVAHSLSTHYRFSRSLSNSST